MKKVLLLHVLIMIALTGFAQNPTLPAGTRPGQLPTPKPTLLKGADLQVTSISFVSITRQATVSLVRLSITIKNNGDFKAGESKIKGYEAWARDGRPGGWKLVAETPAVGAINPGQSVTAEYVFTVNNLTADKKFA